MNINDKNGWLFSGDRSKTHYISSEECKLFLELAKNDDVWVKNVKDEIEYFDEKKSGTVMELLINQFRTMNGGGTIIQFPFGYICTFPSRRHIFRGENQIYPFSESTLSRRCRDKGGKKRSKRDIEILHVISNMRICQFSKFIWQFDTIQQ